MVQLYTGHRYILLRKQDHCRKWGFNDYFSKSNFQSYGKICCIAKHLLSVKINTNTKLRIFEINVLQSSNDVESRKVTKIISNKIDTFETRCPLSTIRYLFMICRMHSTSTSMVAMILTPNTKKEKTEKDLREVS